MSRLGRSIGSALGAIFGRSRGAGAQLFEGQTIGTPEQSIDYGLPDKVYAGPQAPAPVVSPGGPAIYYAGPSGSPGPCGSNLPRGALIGLPTSQGDLETAPSGTLTFTQNFAGSFCPVYLSIVAFTGGDGDDLSARVRIDAITGPGGQSLLLGGVMNSQFFQAKDKRGGQLAGCCLSPGLGVTVTYSPYNSGDTFLPGTNFQGVLYGVIR